MLADAQLLADDRERGAAEDHYRQALAIAEPRDMRLLESCSRLLAIAGVPVELAEAEVAVGDGERNEVLRDICMLPHVARMLEPPQLMRPGMKKSGRPRNELLRAMHIHLRWLVAEEIRCAIRWICVVGRHLAHLSACSRFAAGSERGRHQEGVL